MSKSHWIIWTCVLCLCVKIWVMTQRRSAIFDSNSPRAVSLPSRPRGEVFGFVLWNVYYDKSKDQQVLRSRPLHTNVCTKCHGNPSRSYWDISVLTKVVDLSSNGPNNNKKMRKEKYLCYTILCVFFLTFLSFFSRLLSSSGSTLRP